MKAQDLTNKTFHRLTVISLNRKQNRKYFWNCVCICGNTTTVETSHLKSGHTKSCGCYMQQRISEARTTHGMSKPGKITKEYRAWVHMIGRCENPTNERYYNYGGRGIKICERWRSSFDNFLADIGKAPSKEHSIERKDNNGNYEPGNCRWATPIEQANNKRNNAKLEYQGVVKTITQWAREFGLNRTTIIYRLSLGWSAHDVLTIRPLRTRRSKDYLLKKSLPLKQLE